MKLKIILPAVAALAIIVTWMGLNSHSVSSANMTNQTVTAGREDPATARIQPDNDNPNYESNILVQTLIDRFAAQINDVTVQVQLYQIRRDLIQQLPATGLDIFNTAINQAFPDYADAILALMDKLDHYYDWITQQQPALLRLSELERYGTIWDKRKDIFGDDAELIWAQERHDMEQKQQGVQHILADLEADKTISLEEKLYQLKTRVNELLDQNVVQYANADGLITQVFFSLDSVQQTLQQMPAEQRQQQIDDIRRQMGYSDDQVAHLHDQDQQRNQRWDRGLTYMEQRQQLADALNGNELTTALNELRQQTFGFEAKTIELEEQHGFFRYRRPRIYGRN